METIEVIHPVPGSRVEGTTRWINTSFAEKTEVPLRRADASEFVPALDIRYHKHADFPEIRFFGFEGGLWHRLEHDVKTTQRIRDQKPGLIDEAAFRKRLLQPASSFSVGSWLHPVIYGTPLCVEVEKGRWQRGHDAKGNWEFAEGAVEAAKRAVVEFFKTSVVVADGRVYIRAKDPVLSVDPYMKRLTVKAWPVFDETDPKDYTFRADRVEEARFFLQEFARLTKGRGVVLNPDYGEVEVHDASYLTSDDAIDLVRTLPGLLGGDFVNLPLGEVPRSLVENLHELRSMQPELDGSPSAERQLRAIDLAHGIWEMAGRMRGTPIKAWPTSVSAMVYRLHHFERDRLLQAALVPAEDREIFEALGNAF